MRTFLIAGAAMLALAGAAGAQQLNTGHLSAIDTSGDGAVDATEFAAFSDKAFEALDIDKDGSISRDEAGKVMSPEVFAATDKNGNGRISKAEFTGQMQADFTAADKDGNGKLN